MWPDLFKMTEWSFLLGNTGVDAGGNIALPKWAPKESKEQFGTFMNLFKKLAGSIDFNGSGWDSWANHKIPEENYPGSLKKLSEF